MGINLVESRTAKLPRARLLYCAYDGRVTRHTLRGVENALICVECGHRIGLADAGSAPEEPRALTPPSLPLAVPPRPRGRRGAVRAPRYARPRGIVAVVAAAMVLGTLALVYATRVTTLPESLVAPVAASVPADQAAAARPLDVSPVRVANTEGQGAYVRRTTNLDDRLQAWPDGTVLRVTGPDVVVSGTLWKPVVDPAGNRGWIPSQYTGS